MSVLAAPAASNGRGAFSIGPPIDAAARVPDSELHSLPVHMTSNLRLLTPAIAAALTGTAYGQNDECTGAIPAVANVATAFDTSLATSSAQPWPCALGGTDIWYSYTPTMSGGSVTVDLCGSSYDTAIEAFSGTCGALFPIGCNDDSSCGLQSILQFGPTVPGTPLYFRIGGYNGASGVGTFFLTENPPGMGQDECSGAIALTNGTSVPYDTTSATTSSPQWPCAFNGGPDLWYSYTSTIANGLISVETCGSSYDTSVEIFSGSCAALVSEVCNDDACGLQSIATAATGAVGTTYYIRVGGYNGATGSGTILLNETTNPCTTLGDDMFEDNDDCATATPLADGSYPGLIIQGADNDHFEIGLDDGATLTVDIFFLQSEMDIDVYLWDPNVICGTDVAGEGTTTGALAVGFSASDDESISYTNLTGAAQTLIIETTRYNFNTAGCATYDMDINGSNGMGGQLGSNYCMANANSSGTFASISAAGSRVATNNDVTLTTSDMPLNAFGFYLVSDVQGFVPNPGGSEGNLCLGGGIGRYIASGQIMNSGATGEISLVLDITTIPRPMGNASAMAGDTWNWTTWFRDLVGGVATSNFSNGLSITFI